MQAVYYRDSHGNEPVKDYIDALPPDVQDELDWHIDLLNGLRDTSPPLAFPHSSRVEDEFRELRCHYGRRLYRIIYRRSDQFFVLLHILVKRTDKLPQADIEIAKSRWQDFKSRMDAQTRVPPRAAGHDAPSKHAAHEPS